MQARALEALNRDGDLSVEELDEIVGVACADGEFDDQEKAVLIEIISSLTSADMSDAMWAKVDELIRKFDLTDSEATIEDLDDEVDQTG
jgi:hypothetical protein